MRSKTSLLLHVEKEGGPARALVSLFFQSLPPRDDCFQSALAVAVLEMSCCCCCCCCCKLTMHKSDNKVFSTVYCYIYQTKTKRVSPMIFNKDDLDFEVELPDLVRIGLFPSQNRNQTCEEAWQGAITSQGKKSETGAGRLISLFFSLPSESSLHPGKLNMTIERDELSLWFFLCVPHFFNN